MKFASSVLAVGAAFAAVAEAASTFKPVRPPAYPLAVKSPYLSAWLSAGSSNTKSGNLAGQWPMFWSGQILGWAGMVRVDGKAYTWMGDTSSSTGMATTLADQVSAEYTSTRTTFIMNAGTAVQLNITFLSPVTPEDFKRQSLIFSYLNIDVQSRDGASHQVELYSDISAEWASGNRSNVAKWEYGTVNNVGYQRVYRRGQAGFSEQSEQAEWGNFYYATEISNSTTYQSGGDAEVRRIFTQNGKMGNIQDTTFRAIQDRWPVLGFAKSLGTVGTTPVSTLFTVGLAQKQSVQFVGSSKLAPVNSLWTSYFSTEEESLDFFYNDYADSARLATALDNKVAADSIAVAGQDYATITSLTVRQAFGATVLVGTQDKPYLFLKEISSNGNMQTIDVIFPAFPIFAYTNPTLIKLLLDPHFEYQESGKYPNKYAIHDLGTHFPNATGHNDGNDEAMPLEECGNNLMMVLSYAQMSNDTEFLNTHYSLLKQWTGFLVDEALYPAEQLSTDDFAGHLVNQTNLALKGIIGIRAMAEIADLTGHTDDRDNFTSIATDYITQWQTLGFNTNDSPPHSKLNYNNESSHGILYNLYGDKHLGLGLVPQSVYDMQSTFYPTQQARYGVPLDTRHVLTKTDWELFAAAIASNDTRDMFISKIVQWIEETPTSRPLTDLYQTDSGDHPPGIVFTARPVMGGSFALLTLPGAPGRKNIATGTSTGGETSTTGGTNAQASTTSLSDPNKKTTDSPSSATRSGVTSAAVAAVAVFVSMLLAFH